MGKEDSSPNEDWLRVSEAADYMGVHFTTLRRWSDLGKVPHFQTPGGRRRYKRSDLDKFLDRSQRAGIPVSPEAAQPGIIQEIRSLGMQKQSWYGQISEDIQRNMVKNGRLLIGSLMQYACRQDKAEAILDQGKDLGNQYGQLCRKANLTVIETMQAFVSIRHSIVDSLCEAGVVVKDSGEDTWNIFRRVNHYLDTVMLAILETFKFQAPSNLAAFE